MCLNGLLYKDLICMCHMLAVLGGFLDEKVLLLLYKVESLIKFFYIASFKIKFIFASEMKIFCFLFLFDMRHIMGLKNVGNESK